jgi:hypothetical protein
VNVQPHPEAARLRSAIRALKREKAFMIIHEAGSKPYEEAVLRELFESCAYGEPVAKELIGDFDREWLEAHSWSMIEPYLVPSDPQPFREFAWLYRSIGLSDIVDKVVEKARHYGGVDLEEVVEDFGGLGP